MIFFFGGGGVHIKPKGHAARLYNVREDCAVCQLLNFSPNEAVNWNDHMEPHKCRRRCCRCRHHWGTPTPPPDPLTKGSSAAVTVIVVIVIVKDFDPTPPYPGLPT